MEGSGSVQVITDPEADPGGPKHTDPDAEHWYLQYMVKFGKEGLTQ